MTATQQQQPQKRVTRVTTLATVIFLCLFAVERLVLPQGPGFWSVFPIVDEMTLSGMGICLSLVMVAYTYRAWTLDPAEFVGWHLSPPPAPDHWLRKLHDYLPDWSLLWLFRVVGPVGILLATDLAGFALSSFVVSLISLALTGKP